MQIEKGLLYSKDHEWVKREGTIVKIGITDYAQDKLGDVVFVEVPSLDDQLVQGEPFTVVESVKAVSEIISPIDGTIIAVNDRLEDSPELINDDCYGQGWIVSVEPENEEGLEDLMTDQEYESYLKGV